MSPASAPTWFRPCVAATAVLLAVLTAAAPAARAGGDPEPAAPAAPGPSYAVVQIEVNGDADPQLRAQVQAGLAKGVTDAGAGLIGYDEVQAAIAAKPALQGCMSTTCLAAIGDVVHAKLFLRVTITATGANYELELELLDVDGPRRQRTGTCTVCTTTDLADLAATRVHDLLTADAGGPLPVEIVSKPARATLVIPGVGTQQAPWKGELPPGAHDIEARLDGYAPRHQEITVADDGTEQRFEIVLAPRDVARPFRIAKWGAAGGAAVAVVVGAVLISMDGDPTCGVAGVTCPDVYDTGTAGVSLVVVGVAAAGAAGWMFWSDHQSSHRERAIAVVPTRGGAYVGAHLSF
ncbi:MAG: PEGA domain-containing protein [Kofleriaceae bacterium]|nr:PEGA domain-containing protein [Myxococcales bacterium]MCB9565259.1 PEGA domain-containing protein [Kofleriaceae bacterium]MCB9572379.1 PEGA domain-containing protein [Kofleriaceae bacterium]